MKKRLVITTAITAGMLLAAGSWVVFERSGPSPKIEPGLRAEDPAQIERAVSRNQWAEVRGSLVHPNFKWVFSAPFMEISLGRVREIGPMPDRPVFGWGRSLTNASTCAYATVCRRHSGHCLKYFLNRSTNGWAVQPNVIYHTNDSRL